MSTAPRQGFNFDSFHVRPAAEHDRAYLEQLIEADDYHRGTMTADFFLRLYPGEDAWAIENERGEVELYFRTSTAVRIAIQFRPTQSPADRKRNRRTLMRGMQWIEGIFRRNHFREVITDTESIELQNFAQRHLGFVRATTLSKQIKSYAEVLETPHEAVGTFPTGESERFGDPNVRS